MKINLQIIQSLVFVLFLTASCQPHETKFKYKDKSKISFSLVNGKWVLYRNNKPYFIKGAHGSTHLDWIKNTGGNSVLLYDSELSDSILRKADSLGLSVTVTLDIAKARFVSYSDSNNNELLIRQRQHVEKIVKTYYNYPAILFWVIGNELHIQRANNISMWKEVNEISKIIHSIDPYHPITTTIASFPTTSFDPLQIKLFAPDLDFLSLTIYEFAPRIKRELKSFIWGDERPFLVTEWSGQVYWNLPKTDWGAIIEQNSTINAENFVHNYSLGIEANSDKCIGGYVFYWGQKQERTHTVFSLIIDNKYKTQAFEKLEYIWSATNPQNFSPRLKAFTIENNSSQNLYLPVNKEYTANIDAFDPDGDALYLKWELRTEGEYWGKTGGEAEALTEIISKSDTSTPYRNIITFKTPEKEGPYRLFVYVIDSNNNIATANIPFYTLK